jgi:hypothetical protein
MCHARKRSEGGGGVPDEAAGVSECQAAGGLERLRSARGIMAEKPLGKVILANELVQKILRSSILRMETLEDYVSVPMFRPDGRPYDKKELLLM